MVTPNEAAFVARCVPNLGKTTIVSSDLVGPPPKWPDSAEGSFLTGNHND
jgi:hypothetical protein